MAKIKDENLNSDLGLGSRVAQTSRRRFLNKDGSFNVKRGGLPWAQSKNLYHMLLNVSWPKFFLLVVAAYFVTNIAFAGLYLLSGVGGFEGIDGKSFEIQFLQAFFFSVQTLATIGYGRISPVGLAANVVVTIEALVGLLGFALATGLLFARFSRPLAKVVFSKNALIAPYKGITAFEFRIANTQSSELIDVNATVVFTRIENIDGAPMRRFYALSLERANVMVFPLHWVIVHPIDENSPLQGLTASDLAASDAEFMVLLSAFDETFSQTVHTRSSYKANEIEWGAKFVDLFVPSDDGLIAIDMQKIHDFEKVTR